PSAYVTANPRMQGGTAAASSPGLSPVLAEAPRGPVSSEYTLPTNVMSSPMPQQTVNQEYAIPSTVPEQLPAERQWELDWKMLGPTPDLSQVRHEQLLAAFGPVPDAFKGILFELSGDWISRDRF